MIRVYLRCSTDDQTLDSQRHPVEKYLAAYHEGEAVSWYEEEGVMGDAVHKPELVRLQKDMGKGDQVIVYALDRLSRSGIMSLLGLIQGFTAKGVKLVSLSEPWADSSNPVSEVVIAVMAWAAKQEKARTKERQRAGIAAAKAAGKRWGGRKVGCMQVRTEELDRQVRQLKAAGESVASISRSCKISRPTCYSILADAD